MQVFGGLGREQLGEELKEALLAPSNNTLNGRERSPTAVWSNYTNSGLILALGFMEEEGLQSALK